MPNEIDHTVDSNERYDYLRCRVCGTPHESHSAECQQHQFRPSWSHWLEANPPPTIKAVAVINGLTIADPDDVELAKKWSFYASEAGVPPHLIEGDPPSKPSSAAPSTPPSSS